MKVRESPRLISEMGRSFGVAVYGWMVLLRRVQEIMVMNWILCGYVFIGIIKLRSK